MARSVNGSADYYEPTMRASVSRAMRQLRKSVSVGDIAAAVMSGRTQLFRTGAVQAALRPAAKVVRDAYRQGGRIGADKANAAVRRG